MKRLKAITKYQLKSHKYDLWRENVHRHGDKEVVSEGPLARVQQIKVYMKRENGSEENMTANKESSTKHSKKKQ